MSTAPAPAAMKYPPGGQGAESDVEHPAVQDEQPHQESQRDHAHQKVAERTRSAALGIDYDAVVRAAAQGARQEDIGAGPNCALKPWNSKA